MRAIASPVVGTMARNMMSKIAVPSVVLLSSLREPSSRNVVGIEVFYYSGDGAWQINISFIIAWVGTMHNIQAFSFCNYSLAPWHAVHGLSLEDIV